MTETTSLQARRQGGEPWSQGRLIPVAVRPVTISGRRPTGRTTSTPADGRPRQDALGSRPAWPQPPVPTQDRHTARRRSGRLERQNESVTARKPKGRDTK